MRRRGTAVRLRTTPFKEYRAGSLTIHWLPSSGYLDVWRGRKVLAVERLKGTLRVMRYLPDEEWEQELENAAKA